MCIWHASIACSAGQSAAGWSHRVLEPLQSLIHSSSECCDLEPLLQQVLLPVHVGHAGDVRVQRHTQLIGVV